MFKEKVFKKDFREVKVNHLNLKDRKLAYKNYMNDYIKSNCCYSPCTKEELNNKSVVNLFSFVSSKEGEEYWCKTIDNVLAKQKKIKDYKKEKFILELKQLFVFLILTMFSSIIFVLVLIYILLII